MNEFGVPESRSQEMSRKRKIDTLISRLDPQRAAEMGVVTGSEALEWLSSGDRKGKYVFHGTPFKIEGALEPRQAYSHGKLDGAPGVAASKRPDVSIFRSIISSTRDEAAGRMHHSSWDGDSENIIFRSWPDQLQRAHQEGQIGYVYVFHAADFSDYSGTEVRSEYSVEPVYCISVSVDDLPEGIEEIEQGM